MLVLGVRSDKQVWFQEGDAILKLTVQFLEAPDWLLSRAAFSRSAFSRAMRAAMLSIICPLKLGPSFGGPSVCTHLLPTAAQSSVVRRAVEDAGARRLSAHVLDACVVSRDMLCRLGRCGGLHHAAVWVVGVLSKELG
jgi:hypothetical protein